LDRFVEADFDVVRFLVEDFAAAPVFDDFFVECDFFCVAAAGSRASASEQPASREPSRTAI
jgi:hypothetical protein